jgi:hypothetical protein
MPRSRMRRSYTSSPPSTFIACSGTDLDIHYSVHNSQPQYSLFSQTNPVLIHRSYFNKINFNIIQPPKGTSTSSKLDCINGCFSLFLRRSTLSGSNVQEITRLLWKMSWEEHERHVCWIVSVHSFYWIWKMSRPKSRSVIRKSSRGPTGLRNSIRSGKVK